MVFIRAFICIFFFFLIAFFLPVNASSIPYESSHIDRPSSKFQVKVDGQPVDVVYMDDGNSNHGDTHYAHFEQSGSAQVEITNMSGNINASNSRIRPTSYNIAFQTNGDKMTFTSPSAKHLIVEINMNATDKINPYPGPVLYLFIDPPEPARPNATGATVKNAETLGIQSAFNQANAGDTIYVPRGKYTINTTLNITKDNVTLYLEPGAFITMGSSKIPISVDNVNNVTIKGRGTIESGAPGIAVTRTTNFKMEDIILRNAACPSDTGFFFLLFSTKNSILRNIKVAMLPTLGVGNKCGRAALVLNSNQDLLIENSFLESHEDGTAIKSFQWTGLAINRQPLLENKNIVIRNNLLFHGNDLGTESDTNTSNVLWDSNIMIVGSHSHHSRDANDMSNILYKNEIIEGVIKEDFFTIGGLANGGLTATRGTLSIRFENLTVNNFSSSTTSGIRTKGTAGVAQNVIFENLKVKGRCINSLNDLRQLGLNPIVEDVNIQFTSTNNCANVPTPTFFPISPLPITPTGTISCPNKFKGDADCRPDTAGRIVNILDYAIWYSEFIGGCSETNLSGCGVNADNIETAMDSNFNFPGSGHIATDMKVDVFDYAAWIQGFVSQ